MVVFELFNFGRYIGMLSGDYCVQMVLFRKYIVRHLGIKNGSIPYLFADDTKIFHSIKCTQDCKDLQEDIKAMQVCQKNGSSAFTRINVNA